MIDLKLLQYSASLSEVVTNRRLKSKCVCVDCYQMEFRITYVLTSNKYYFTCK